MNHPFRVGLTRDFLNEDERPIDAGLPGRLLSRCPGIEVVYLPERQTVIAAEHLRGLDALICFASRCTRETFEGADRLVLLARFGVGFDTVDLDACTEADVILTLTRGQARRPVAEAALTMMLAISHRVLIKDRLARESGWHARGQYQGIELRDRVVGVVGFGEIGQELFRLLKPFGLRRALATDPYPNREAAAALGVELVGLDEVLRESDFVSIHCPLAPETKGLIGARELGLMRPTAYLINTARGAVIDQRALTETLVQRRIAGAALDVFEQEPVPPDEPLLRLDNVLLSPHATAWTDELFRDYTNSCAESIAAVIRGEAPEHVVNREVLTRPGLRAKLNTLAQRALGELGA